jgi:hypothetical protein
VVPIEVGENINELLEDEEAADAVDEEDEVEEADE